MKKQEVTRISQECLSLIENSLIVEAVKTVEPVLQQKIPFLLLDHAGEVLGGLIIGKPRDLITFLDRIEATKAMGGYVVIGSVLNGFIEHDLTTALGKSKEYISKGRTWYVADIIGERVPGQALVKRFDEAFPILETFLREPDLWVKRSVGVAAHFFAKRVRGDAGKAKRVIDLLSPCFEEKDTRIVKGIGWGLKTLGRYYPDLVVDFLKCQQGRKPSSLLMKKAITYLSPEKRAEIR